MTSNAGALWRYSFFNILILCLIGLWFLQQNQPVSLVEPQLPANGKLQCVSYAPYYGKDQSPFVKGTIISKAQIENDLKLLAKTSQCVRIYSVGQGLDYVPEAASKTGLKVLLGAWIGWSDIENTDEINLATKLANTYPQTVVGLIAGNEVLLRGEQTELAMATYIAQAKRATKVPVTYADVWEFWLKHPALESSVDFVTVHILPYWEDDPQPISNAIHHVDVVMDKLSHTFKKPIMIGETGWPSAGRHRNASVPSVVNQAHYMREFLQRAQEAKWNYNVIEAIDQPWKRLLEGAVGGYWGLYNAELQPKFSFTGNVAERQDGFKPLYWATAGLCLILAIVLATGERRASALIGAAALGVSTGLMALLQFGYLIIACRDVIEWAVLGGLTLAGVLTLLAMPVIVLRQKLYGPADILSKNIIRISLFCFVLSGAIAGVLLMPKALLLQPLSQAMPFFSGFFYNLDGRYRDFPLAIFLLPVLQLSIGLWLAQLQTLTKTTSRLYRYLNIIALATMAIFLLSEPLNGQAYTWTALVLLLVAISWPRKQLHQVSNPSI